MQLLAEKGADLEVRDIHGDTAYGMCTNKTVSKVSHKKCL